MVKPLLNEKNNDQKKSPVGLAALSQSAIFAVGSSTEISRIRCSNVLNPRKCTKYSTAGSHNI
jgi:hypothetical protein